MKKLTVVPLFFIGLLAFSQTEKSIVKLVNPPSVATPNGYSHVSDIDLGNCRMILIAGQVALDKQGNLVGKNDLGKQAEQVFLNIKNILQDLGGQMANLVKINIYMMDVNQVQMVRDVRNKFIDVKTPPISTLVQISRLFRDDMLLEIEATAIIPK